MPGLFWLMQEHSHTSPLIRPFQFCDFPPASTSLLAAKTSGIYCTVNEHIDSCQLDVESSLVCGGVDSLS